MFSWWTAAMIVLWPMLHAAVAPAGQPRAAAMPVREADAVCATCHAEIVSSYLKTPMANASGLAAERLLPGSYRDRSSGVQYTIGREADGALLRYATGDSGAGPLAGSSASGTTATAGTAGDGITRAEDTALTVKPGFQGAERLRYFLGSGHIGLTYLYEKNGYWLESPVAFYEKLRGYTMAPGLEGLHEMPPALPLNPSCLRCHMSRVQRQVAGTDNLYRGLPFEQVGITCESCHGDAREHVATKGRATVVNPVKLTPERRDSTCIVCHLEGDTSVERQGRAVLDYKPGDDIRDSITYFVRAGATSTRRAVSEVEQFGSSRCRLASGPSMSCMSCHTPHGSPTAEERVGFYRAKCLTCHSGQTFAAEHFPANPDCTSCHMPKTGSENIAHVAWTDHRIRREPEAGGLTMVGMEPKVEGPIELVSVLPGATAPRDLGLAYYNLAVNGVKPARARAAELLGAAVTVNAGDVPVLRSLGILAEMGGESARAATFYRAALRIAPEDYVAGTNLGTLLAKSGDLEAAAGLWKDAFGHNGDVPELGQNLAVMECRMGDRDGARTVLTEVLTYSPGLSRAREMLSGIESGAMPCGGRVQAPASP